MPAVEAVLFDYGLVLSGPPDLTAWQSLQLLLSTDEPTLHSAYWKHRHDYDRGVLNGHTYWLAVAADCNQYVSEDRLEALRAQDVKLWTQPNQAMIAWAGHLQRAGVKTGILSNIGDAIEEGIRTDLPWLAAFSHHTFSHRLGIAKPELAIYAHSAKGLGVHPTSILFIDDREENIHAAKQAGMRAIQYLNDERFLSEMHEMGLQSLLAV